MIANTGRPEIAERRIAQMVQRIVARFRPIKIILFGSYARGTAGPDSDVDLLVVMPFTGSRRAKMVELLGAVQRISFPVDVLVATPKELIRKRRIAGSLICSAAEEGKIVYERRR